MTQNNNCRQKTIDRYWILLSLVPLILLFSACDTEHASQPAKKLPNVVIIVMDTTRQDRLGCYGYKRDTSPNLTKLASESVTYTRAYTPGGWTPPAHASLFTGLFSIAHQTTQEAWKMGDNLTTLAEVFKAEGYETIGITENPMLNTRNNFNQGFLHYHETWRSKDSGENIAFSLFKKALSKRKTPKPFFMFINLIEPHSPYDSSEQFYNRFISDKSVPIVSNMWREYFLGDKTFTDKEIIHLNELYDAEILYTDYVTGNIVTELQARNLLEETVFIVTSDHGENIGDHEMMDHVFSLHESIIKVPLIIRYPKYFTPGLQVEYPVQLTDIFPTLLEIIDVDTRPYSSQGRSLLDQGARDDTVVFSEYYYPKQVLKGMDRRGLLKGAEKSTPLDNYKRRIRAVIKGDMKFIWGSDDNHELYDLSTDPEEKENLIDRDDQAETRKELEELLYSMVKKYDIKTQKALPAKDEELDKATRDRIKSLGYIR